MRYVQPFNRNARPFVGRVAGLKTEFVFHPFQQREMRRGFFANSKTNTCDSNNQCLPLESFEMRFGKVPDCGIG